MQQHRTRWRQQRVCPRVQRSAFITRAGWCCCDFQRALWLCWLLLSLELAAGEAGGVTHGKLVGALAGLLAVAVTGNAAAQDQVGAAWV
jgi:hypothetical protein